MNFAHSEELMHPADKDGKQVAADEPHESAQSVVVGRAVVRRFARSWEECQCDAAGCRQRRHCDRRPATSAGQSLQHDDAGQCGESEEEEACIHHPRERRVHELPERG
ncbi:hypothetical protein ABZ897_31935 [Nonomuraea sp. NPDC046802]|uniref:hypothetical protein n=1 Tax=Nonomuraea sp. NPDC046802 TaxID=3154919 RepID=UPI00340787BA